MTSRRKILAVSIAEYRPGYLILLSYKGTFFAGNSWSYTYREYLGEIRVKRIFSFQQCCSVDRGLTCPSRNERIKIRTFPETNANLQKNKRLFNLSFRKCNLGAITAWNKRRKSKEEATDSPPFSFSFVWWETINSSYSSLFCAKQNFWKSLSLPSTDMRRENGFFPEKEKKK